MKQYEAMFLFDPNFGSSFENCEKEIRRLMDRAEAELVFCRLWDERRLAYRIKGRKRGVYVLTYFKAATDRITGLERDVNISEDILRVLVTRADHMTTDMMERALQASAEEGDSSVAGRRPGDAPPKTGPSVEATSDAKEKPSDAKEKPSDSEKKPSDSEEKSSETAEKSSEAAAEPTTAAVAAAGADESEAAESTPASSDATSETA
ncbi:MAG: 30S ribosomal protein S6 [Planctomycetes bacterium]|nr:30S ribosomal protein S6 [Planctomycetota bacterium]